jgi:hypothetical protein
VLSENRDRILASLPDEALVLDIGGWARPFQRANYVVDAFPYESRGIGGSDGSDAERFTADTWIVADVNRRLPFADKQFDFVTCSHTLEDIRDPLSLCREINRVGKAGYIETPSRKIETVYGVEGRYAGLYHHRWLVEVEGDTIIFRPKLPLLHGSSRFHLPRRTADGMTEKEKAVWLFWEGSFSYEEVVNISKFETEDELAAFRRRAAPRAVGGRRSRTPEASSVVSSGPTRRREGSPPPFSKGRLQRPSPTRGRWRRSSAFTDDGA